MAIFGVLYRGVIYQPIFNLLVFLYNLIPGHDLGIAIIVLTALVRIALFPLSQKALRSQRAMQSLQPKLRELQTQHAGDKEKQARATMELYASHKVNPASSCLPLLIQFPFLIGIYRALRDGLAQKITLLYPWVRNPGSIDPSFLRLLDLAKPSIVLAVLAGITQYLLARLQTASVPRLAPEPGKKEDMTAMMNKQMLYMMPAVTVLIGARLPAGLALYWLATNLFTVLQQWYFMKGKKPAAAAS